MSTHLLKKLLFAALLFAVPLANALAPPAASRLLPLIPGDVESIAGVENPHRLHGHVLLVTRANTLDLDDWLALTGVDMRRTIDEIMWIEASSPRGELREHAVLVAGRFDRDRIFTAAAQNGAESSFYRGVRVLVVKPFSREAREMHDDRWFAILDDQIAVFGTPALIQGAIGRYAAQDAADPVLMNHLAALHPDVDSWNILRMPPQVLARNLPHEALSAPWARILEGADELTLAVHYGSSARIDFVVHAGAAGKPFDSADLLTQPLLLPAALAKLRPPRWRDVSADQNRIQGSIAVPAKQLENWLEALRQRHLIASNAH